MSVEPEVDQWKRATVGFLMDLLDGALAAGIVTRDTEVGAESDPEGNDLHPVRQGFSIGSFVGDGRSLEFEDSEDEPAKVILFGVGY